MAASSRNTRQRVLYDDTRIDLHHLRPWAGGGSSRRRHRRFKGMAAGAPDEPIS